jgi:hypothetical protein
MPERKGRKRKPARERTRGGAAPQAGAAIIDDTRARNAAPVAKRRAPANNAPLPSSVARATGLMLAVVTAVLATLMVYQAATGDASGLDAVLRVGAGVLLVILAVVVGVLSAVPAMVRDWFQRRR